MKRTEQKDVRLIYDLVDVAILPAALMILSKVLSITAINYFLGLDWSVRSVANSVFSIGLVYNSAEDAVLVSSYSNLFMFVSVIAGCMVVTGKSLLLNHRRASPYFVLKLAKYDLLHLLKSSFHIYKEAFVWTTFLIITTVYIFVSFLLGMTYGWVATMTLLFTLIFIWIMVQNIEEELLFNNYK
ncbi:MAG: hypothetical protein KatS3mg084_0497 [Candidatus Dojkabacteria bacterium]|jgi:hypothetical protein|nr:MAG: hypothetical protein KatS3mg084_0497 [Candidatus Dojkabacteria bacterium]